ncbi:MAG: RsmG family class I SAM-dependent methyltransferase, partial [Thermoleophilaceae bacterium]
MSVSRETVAALAKRYALPPDATDRLVALLEALASEPAAPTTVTEPREAVDRHLADSLSGLEIPALRRAARIADLGAGAGIPRRPPAH